mmetsp:Transcript_28306/g.78155  ORF Transcript_28306/g.78155 Transcript_28306/m.78155 type:complete len:244 (+) Transcript_28306:3-734(+)
MMVERTVQKSRSPPRTPAAEQQTGKQHASSEEELLRADEPHETLWPLVVPLTAIAVDIVTKPPTVARVVVTYDLPYTRIARTLHAEASANVKFAEGRGSHTGTRDITGDLLRRACWYDRHARQLGACAIGHVGVVNEQRDQSVGKKRSNRRRDRLGGSWRKHRARRGARNCNRCANTSRGIDGDAVMVGHVQNPPCAECNQTRRAELDFPADAVDEGTNFRCCKVPRVVVGDVQPHELLGSAG